MSEQKEEQRPTPRSATKIFGDLRALAQRDGAIHELSAMIYRDWVTTIDVKEIRVTDDPARRWSTEKISKNELMLLIGLAVQSPTDRTFSVTFSESDFAEKADPLLRELHDYLLVAVIPKVGDDGIVKPISDDDIGPYAREAIYYGADSFYLHQFATFSRHRYRADAAWLQRNAGLSIRPMLNIAKFICDRINNRMNAVGHLRRGGQVFSAADLTNSLIIEKDDLTRKFGAKAIAFLAKFATPAVAANPGFVDPFSVNQVAIAPLIDLGTHIYVPNQYRLMETLYESPFYWMIDDKAYRNTHAENRGRFLEAMTTQLLTNVFGLAHVHPTVFVGKGKKRTGGEIDALVVFGEFVIVAQAKSKRVRLSARAGDTTALEEDFYGAIRAPYEQALDCIRRMKAGEPCVDQQGTAIPIPETARFFPLVVLSDPFPSATLLSDKMLKSPAGMQPVIWDIGILDCVTRIIPQPIDLLFYLQSRAEMFETGISDSEYNFLGFHLRAKLVLPKDTDGLLIDRDFATVVDNYMIACDLGLNPDRPRGVLEELDIPAITDILSALRLASAEMAGPVVDLYDFSYESLESIARQLTDIRAEVRQGKVLKAFSILTRTGGFTFATVRQADGRARDAAEMIGRKHKYKNKRDRWYVILDDVRTDVPIDGLLPLLSTWREDLEEAELAAQVDVAFKTRRQLMTADVPVSQQDEASGDREAIVSPQE